MVSSVLMQPTIFHCTGTARNFVIVISVERVNTAAIYNDLPDSYLILRNKAVNFYVVNLFLASFKLAAHGGI